MTRNSLVGGAYPRSEPPRIGVPDSAPPEPGTGVHRRIAALIWALVGDLDRGRVDCGVLQFLGELVEAVEVKHLEGLGDLRPKLLDVRVERGRDDLGHP